MLREEQRKGAIVVSVRKTMKFMQGNDKILIMNLATTK